MSSSPNAPDTACPAAPLRDRGPLLYRFLRPVARGILEIFFQRLEAAGLANLPADGPVVVVGNHPNMLLDGLVLGVTCPRPVHFLGKSTLFEVPLLAAFLRAGGVLPVYRPRDNQPTEKNEATFAACHAILGAGSLIALFPEGTSHSEMKMLRFKTGAARIALVAAAACPAPLRIVPCGLWYTAKSRWGSSCLAVYGKPIAVAAYQELHARDEREAVRALTQAAEDGLRDLLIELDDQRQGRLLKLVEGMYRHRLGGGADLEERWRFARTVLEGWRAFQEREPERIAPLVAELEEHAQDLDDLGLSPAQVARRPGRLRAAGLFLVHLAWLVAAAVPAAAGLLANLLPYLVTLAVVRLRTLDQEEVATVKLLGGMVVYGLWYAVLLAAGIAWLGGPGAAIAPAAALLGLVALRYVRVLARFLQGVRIFLLMAAGRRLADTLRARQEALLAELDRLGDELARSPS